MESNGSSVAGSGGLGLLTAAVEELAAEDLARLPDSEAAARVLVLRRLVDRLEGHWLRELAGVDGRGAAGTEAGTHVPPPPHGSAAACAPGTPEPAAGSAPPEPCTAAALGGTAHALAAGDLSPRHAAVLAAGTDDLPPPPPPRPNQSCWR